MAVRASMKEPAKSQAAKNGAYSYNRAVWEGGVQGSKTRVESV